jgi:hypothetical protein
MQIDLSMVHCPHDRGGRENAQGDFLLALFDGARIGVISPCIKRNNRRNRCFKIREESRAALAPFDEACKYTHMTDEKLAGPPLLVPFSGRWPSGWIFRGRSPQNTFNY